MPLHVMDWGSWHKNYDILPGLQARLRLVQEQTVATLSECSNGSIKILSICAGDGRDLIGALDTHSRKGDVIATLIDNHLETVERGRSAASKIGLDQHIKFIHADASLAATYIKIAPADMVLISGMLGHLSHEDVRGFIANLPMLCTKDAVVIWNRHLVMFDGRRQIPIIRGHFKDSGFQEIDFVTSSPDGFAVGRVRYTGPAVSLDPQHVFFKFEGIDRLSSLAAGRKLENSILDMEECATVNKEYPGITLKIEQTIPKCFDEVVARNPSGIAVSTGNWKLTYSELNAAANQFAHTLVGCTGVPGDRTAILLCHDSPLIVAILAVLKAGRVAVVLNSTDPVFRLKQILSNAGATVLVTDASHRKLAESIGDENCRVIDFEAARQEPNFCPEIKTSPNDPAFLVYTSGSTGAPKSVIQTHRNIIHNALRLSQGMNLTHRDHISLLASPSGGQGVSTIWCTLLNGATLFPFPVMEKGVATLAMWIHEHGITILIAAASLFRHFIRALEEDTVLATVRLVRLASEPAVLDDFLSFQRHFTDDCILLNTLSSSETGNLTQQPLSKSDRIASKRLPVGFPAAGIEISLVDGRGRTVPHGEIGEIVVKSRFISPGYWRNKPLSSQRFVESGEPDEARLFFTGDLGRLMDDGALLFLGRKDEQVKIRGYRVETSEIEHALTLNSAVESAAVCAQRGLESDDRLVAYVVCKSGQKVSPESLRIELERRLPRYMIPARFILVDAIPLTPHGKVDRQMLREINFEPIRVGSFSGEQLSTTEQLIANIWKEIFNCERIGRFDNIFDLGGDSFTTSVVAAKILTRLEVEIDLRVFAQYPTLGALARAVEDLQRAGPVPGTPKLVRVTRDSPLPLSFAQERTWIHSQTPEGSAGYSIACAHRIRGPLNAEAWHETILYLQKRHEILRTTFDSIDGNLAQIVQPPGPVPMQQIDLSKSSDAVAEATTIFREKAFLPFDLRNGPLVRFFLLRISESEHWFLRFNHHIISDGWSWGIYFREFGLIYEARRRGHAPPLPEYEQLQYADYAAWQRRVIDPSGHPFRDAVEWWKRRFKDAPNPQELPFARQEPLPDAPFSDGLLSWGLDISLSKRLDHFTQTEGITYYCVRLAALGAFLANGTLEHDVILGAYVTNRNSAQTQNLFGFFSNIATLRLQCDPEQSFREWARKVRQVVTETQAYSDIPYELLCEELRKSGTIVPEIRFILNISDQNAPLHFDELEVTWLDRRMECMPWGFTLIFDQHNEETHCRVAFDARIYDRDGVVNWIASYVKLLDGASRNPDLSIRELLAKT